MGEKKKQLFDEWPEKYDHWFTTSLGILIKEYESRLILDFLEPNPGELILDAGCGTGVFTLDILAKGAKVIGVDISLPMLKRAGDKMRESKFQTVLADIIHLPFAEGIFDRSVSITTLEFIKDGKRAVWEMFRVTKKGGVIVVATLNSLSPWAQRRKAEAKEDSIFAQAIFRSPEELLALAPVKGLARTAIHFLKDENPDKARLIEAEGQRKNLDTGAFLAARWVKP
ncbi:MAG: class I SAM-dependent methyltransferase [Thermodesulfobacteriota bacterium]